MRDPCRFSPDARTAAKIAKFYASLFPERAKVLDIGFGQGFLLEACRQRGLDVVGVERDSSLVRSARERGFDALEADASRFDTLPLGHWDVVSATHLIEHMTPDELQGFLRDCGSLLSAGGQLLLSTPNMADWRVASEWFWLDPTHVRPYPPGAVQVLLDPAVWDWVSDGYEPTRHGRHWPIVMANRCRFGTDFGRSGRWYLLARKASATGPMGDVPNRQC